MTSKRQGAQDPPIHGFTEADEDSPSGEQLSLSGPVTPSPGLLSSTEQRFCQEYLVDLNGTKAYERVHPGVSYDSARTLSARLLAKVHIRDEIQRLMDERATVTGITADRVLLRLWAMATADARELVEVRITCCRHCWGLYHQHQYTDTELELAEYAHIQAEAKRRKKEGDKFEPREFHGKGGGGFDATRKPHPECPECGGQGSPQHVVKDTRDLSPGAAMLYGGVKLSKDGAIAIIVKDNLPALKLVGEHLGMWNAKLPGPNEAVDPLTLLLQQIHGAHGTGGALPIVHNDPEAGQPKADVTDVQPKAPAARQAAPQPRQRAPGAPSKPSTPWRPA